MLRTGLIDKSLLMPRGKPYFLIESMKIYLFSVNKGTMSVPDLALEEEEEEERVISNLFFTSYHKGIIIGS